MSLITRCPACKTMFKVVPDQLRISSGWVRCGQCSEVFDANAQLVGEMPAPAAPPSPPTPPPASFSPSSSPAVEAPSFDATPVQPATSDEPGRWVFPETPEQATEATVADANHIDAAALPQPGFTPDQPATEFQGEGAAASPENSWDPVAPAIPEQVEPEWAPAHIDAAVADAVDPTEPHVDPASVKAVVVEVDAVHAEPQAVKPSDSFDDEEPPWVARRDDATAAMHDTGSTRADESEVASPSFMSDARRQATWHRPAVRAGLWLASLALTLALLAQVVMQQGDQLAVREPRLKPLLNQACEVLQCTIQAVKDKDALVIDGSAFNKLRGDHYRLALTVRNTAMIEIAMPAIELTLTDARDQPLVQRVLLARELTSAPASLAAGGEWSGHLSLQVSAASGDNRVAGYRLLAFYP